MEKEIASAKKQKNTESTHKTLNTYVQDFKYFICSTSDDVCHSNPGKAAKCFLLSTSQQLLSVSLRGIKSGILSYSFRLSKEITSRVESRIVKFKKKRR
jgi:hypothetical protein